MPKGKAKGSTLQIRFSDAEKSEFAKLAKKEGLTLSAWIRQTLIEVVNK